MIRRLRSHVRGAASGSTCTVMTLQKSRSTIPSLSLFAIRVERKKATPVSPNCRLSSSSSVPHRLLLGIRHQPMHLDQPCSHRLWTLSNYQYHSHHHHKPMFLSCSLYSPGLMAPACRPVVKHSVHPAFSDQKPPMAHPPKAQMVAPRPSAPVSPKPAATPLPLLPRLTYNTFPAAQRRVPTSHCLTKTATRPPIHSSPPKMPSTTFSPSAGPPPPLAPAAAPSNTPLPTPPTAQMASQPPTTSTALTLPSHLPPLIALPSLPQSTARPRLSHSTYPPLHRHPCASRPRPRPKCLRKCCPTPFPRQANMMPYGPSVAMP